MYLRTGPASCTIKMQMYDFLFDAFNLANCQFDELNFADQISLVSRFKLFAFSKLSAA